jgi:hypothetical protein
VVGQSSTSQCTQGSRARELDGRAWSVTKKARSRTHTHTAGNGATAGSSAGLGGGEAAEWRVVGGDGLALVGGIWVGGSGAAVAAEVWAERAWRAGRRR